MTSWKPALQTGRPQIPEYKSYQYLGGVAERFKAPVLKYDAQLTQHLETMKLKHASDLAMFSSIIEAGQNSIRTLIAINGGASVAMLAFLGHLATNSPNDIPRFAVSFAPFAIGTLLSGLVSGITYIGQSLYGAKYTKMGFAFNILAVALGFSAYASFAFGAYYSYLAFVSYSLN
jgi:hypothetical protein